jgi:hypothetical protein
VEIPPAGAWIGKNYAAACPVNCDAMSLTWSLAVPAFTVVVHGGIFPDVSVSFPAGVLTWGPSKGSTCLWNPNGLTVIHSTAPAGWLCVNAGGLVCAGGYWLVGIGVNNSPPTRFASGAYRMVPLLGPPNGTYAWYAGLGVLNNSAWPASLIVSSP